MRALARRKRRTLLLKPFLHLLGVHAAILNTFVVFVKTCEIGEKSEKTGSGNGFLVKVVPCRKIDMTDAQWLAKLARAGLLSASFLPPQPMRPLRWVARSAKSWSVNQPTHEELDHMARPGQCQGLEAVV